MSNEQPCFFSWASYPRGVITFDEKVVEVTDERKKEISDRQKKYWDKYRSKGKYKTEDNETNS